MADPVDGRDYLVLERPYFSTPWVYFAQCIECPYTTGKRTRREDAVASFTEHWRAKHVAPPDSDE